MKDLNSKLLNTPKMFKRENDIIEWGIARNIIGNTAQGTFEGQQEKTRQEWEEWKECHSQDDLGDIFVTLVMQCALKETTVSDCVEFIFGEGFDNFGKLYENDTPEGIDKNLDDMIEDLLQIECYFDIEVGYAVEALYLCANARGWTLNECIEVAWNDIKDRTGLMLFGMFIKQKNLDALEEYGVFYSSSLNKLTGTVYSSEDLQEVDKLFYQLGITYTNEGDYANGVYIESTGKAGENL